MHNSLEGIIEKRKKAWKNGETTKDDLLGTLLQASNIETQGQENMKKTNGMTTKEVIEECRLFYLAGQETVADLLVWTMVLLAKYPEWQERAREEVLQVFGNQIPNFEGLTRLKVVCITQLNFILDLIIIIKEEYVKFQKNKKKNMCITETISQFRNCEIYRYLRYDISGN